MKKIMLVVMFSLLGCGNNDAPVVHESATRFHCRAVPGTHDDVWCDGGAPDVSVDVHIPNKYHCGSAANQHCPDGGQD